MIRFALVHPGELTPAFVRCAKRLRGGEISAVVEADEAAAEAAGRALDIATWATSTDEMHAHFGDTFDAWAVVTAHGLVISRHDNRPFPIDPARWEDLPAGWLWGNTRRFSPELEAIHGALDAGKLGAPGLLRVHDWRPDPAALAANVVCQLDAACWLMGAAPHMVYALAPPPDKPGAHESRQIHLGFPSGAMALLDASAPVAPGYFSLHVLGSAGAAYVDDHHNAQLLLAPDGPRAWWAAPSDFALRAALQEYLDARAADRAPKCGDQEWRRARRLSQAVARSLTEAAAVAFEESAP